MVSQEVVKNKKFNKLNIKVNNLENQIPDVSVLIQTNQYEADTIFGEKLEMLIKKTCC